MQGCVQPDWGYTCFDWFKKLRLFVYVLNLKIDVVLKALRAVVIRWFSLNVAPLGLFKFISDYHPLKAIIVYDIFLCRRNRNMGETTSLPQVPNKIYHLKIDRNLCSVHEEITSIRLYTPCNPLRAVVIRWFSLNVAPLGLFKFISDYLLYF
jgi:hypothetical protein